MLEELKKAFRARQFWVSFGTFFVVMLGYSLLRRILLRNRAGG